MNMKNIKSEKSKNDHTDLLIKHFIKCIFMQFWCVTLRILHKFIRKNINNNQLNLIETAGVDFDFFIAIK